MDSRPALTESEERIVRELVRAGESNLVLARRLGMQTQTLKAHLTTAMAKSETTNRTALALWWIRRGQYEGALDS